jgi:hypothetical protein
LKHPCNRLVFLMTFLTVIGLLLLAPSSAGWAQTEASQGRDSTGLDTARIEQMTGAKGTLDAKEGVFKVSVPRKGPRGRPSGEPGRARWSWETSWCWNPRSIP